MIDRTSKWYMAGTNQSVPYTVIAATGLGTIGISEYARNKFCIRVEPTCEGMFELESHFRINDGWRLPGDNEARENRFEKRVYAPLGDRAPLADTVKFALLTLISDGQKFEVNPEAPEWATRMVAHAVLVAQVRALKVRGCNLASRWSAASLARHLLQAA